MRRSILPAFLIILPLLLFGLSRSAPVQRTAVPAADRTAFVPYHGAPAHHAQITIETRKFRPRATQTGSVADLVRMTGSAVGTIGDDTPLPVTVTIRASRRIPRTGEALSRKGTTELTIFAAPGNALTVRTA